MLIEAYNEGSDVTLTCKVSGGKLNKQINPTLITISPESLYRTTPTECDVVLGQYDHR